jgi:hypothetical protein
MQKILGIVAIAAMSSALPHFALAQSSQEGQSSPSMQAQVKSNLEQAGFTDIRIMPESFLVRAKDKDGNPVMMVINPDSVTAITAMSGDQGSASSQVEKGQTGGKSAKMTDNQANSAAQQEQNRTTSKSAKMSGAAPSQDVDGEKIPGRPNGMLAETVERGTLNLSVAQRAAIWKRLGREATKADTASDTLKVGEAVLDTMRLQSLPSNLSHRVPAVKSYRYGMLHGQVLIVDPTTKKIVAIITE